MKQSTKFFIQKEQVVTFIILLMVSIISFDIFQSKIISSDDWSLIVAKYAFGDLHPILLNDRRPFFLMFYYFMASIFGLHFEYYYFANFLILLFSAYLIYIILRQVFPKYGWFFSLVALVYLIYPVDFSRIWIIMIYIHLMWLTSLLAIWLLLRFVKSGNWWIFFGAILAIIFPLGAYEGQFGLIALAGVLIVIAMPKLPIKRRLISFGGIFIIGLLFLIWRFFIQGNYLDIHDAYVEVIQFAPTILLQRYLQGLNIFAWGWLVPISNLLKQPRFEILGLWLLWVIFSYLFMQFFISKRSENKELPVHKKISASKQYLKFFLLGGMFWIAGYMPIITLFEPSLSSHASRINLFATPGAALMLVSAVTAIAIFAIRSPKAQQLFAMAVLLPFILAGIFVQLQVNRENQIAWNTQKEIWNGIFETIPNIVDHKLVVVIIPGYQKMRPFQALPFSTNWEIDSGAQVLYNNPNIGAYYYYKDIHSSDLVFTPKGFKDVLADKAINFKRLIFVYYHPDSQTIELVEDLEEMFSLSFEVSNYSPHENLTPANPEITRFRWLVQ